MKFSIMSIFFVAVMPLLQSGLVWGGSGSHGGPSRHCGGCGTSLPIHMEPGQGVQHAIDFALKFFPIQGDEGYYVLEGVREGTVSRCQLHISKYNKSYYIGVSQKVENRRSLDIILNLEPDSTDVGMVLLRDEAPKFVATHSLPNGELHLNLQDFKSDSTIFEANMSQLKVIKSDSNVLKVTIKNAYSSFREPTFNRGSQSDFSYNETVTCIFTPGLKE